MLISAPAVVRWTAMSAGFAALLAIAAAIGSNARAQVPPVSKSTPPVGTAKSQSPSQADQPPPAPLSTQGGSTLYEKSKAYHQPTKEKPVPKRTISAHVVALDQPYMWNRLGASQPNAMMYALARDVVPTDYDSKHPVAFKVSDLRPGCVRLRDDKRPRPLVLRVNEGDELVVTFTNLLAPVPPAGTAIGSVTRYASFHVMGLELIDSIASDSSWVGTNTDPADPNAPGSLCTPGATKVYKYYARAEGTFLVHSFSSDSPSAVNSQLQSGLFGVVNVQPEGAEYYRSQILRDDLEKATYYMRTIEVEQLKKHQDNVAGLRTLQEKLQTVAQDFVYLPKQSGVYYLDQTETITNMHLAVQLDDGGALKMADYFGTPYPVYTLTTIVPSPVTQLQKRTLKTTSVILLHHKGDPDELFRLHLANGQHLVNYVAIYPRETPFLSGQPMPQLPQIVDPTRTAAPPVLSMLYPAPDPVQFPKRKDFELIYSDLTAIITGPSHDRWPYSINGPLFRENPSSPDRRQPYREFTIVYHYNFNSVQAFPQLTTYAQAGGDFFGINYGCAGIGAEILSNRLGRGPMGHKDAVDLKFEEFFLSSWSCGDPAMVVDTPANSPNEAVTGEPPLKIKPILSVPSTAALLNELDNKTLPAIFFTDFQNHNPPITITAGTQPAVLTKGKQWNITDSTGATYLITLEDCNNAPTLVAILPGQPPAQPLAAKKATKAFYPDDPSNVYHSYMRDHVKFRVLNASEAITHVHHQHAHQWLHSPNSDNGQYLDSQTVVAGSGYTMEISHGGSGNRNYTVGDSIFHCHFYPHFAEGMWSLWRVHDTFESGTSLDKDGRPVTRIKREGGKVYTVYLEQVGGATQYYYFDDMNNRHSVSEGDFQTAWNRALPDGEIETGTPTPGLVPMPSLAMAPRPARVRVIDDGRRVEVEPEDPKVIADAKKVYPADPDKWPDPYKNPGYPFFIPAVSGHRPPHPPLDYAWKEDENNNPILDKTTGKKFYLDGGLPRHQVLNGDIVRDVFSPWDFTKDFVELEQDKKPPYVAKAGGLVAFELPEEGTVIEKVAMKTHSTRARFSYMPNGDPANFILNGLPAVPGAPYAPPGVRLDGSSNVNIRRYKAALLQIDAVLNKKGWHYPQQRMLALWEDIKPTVTGERPPQPFFFRSNTDDTIEYWHTNLIPNYYELDDFQVRTPTDVLGQHIHLVKFDVTASDGAGNGFNYEDGTFSPQEVRERIAAINAKGGLYLFDEAKQYQGATQKCLEVKLVNKEYPAAPNATESIFGSPPPFQNWDGAQTTIQRFDTDPTLNSEGLDRTVRSVFTHDHFSPSTHQQTGLYAALLVEPDDSTWEIPVITTDNATKKPLVKYIEGGSRKDGGPTSWQANIIMADKNQSYREFALEFQDMQLAYLPCSRPCPQNPAAITPAQFMFPLSSPARTVLGTLKQGDPIPPYPSALWASFADNGIILTNKAVLAKLDAANTQYEIDDTRTIEMTPCKEGGGPGVPVKHDVTAHYPIDGKNSFGVSMPDTPPSWADPANVIGKNGTTLAPQLISFGTIGTYSVNYRNEPLPLRVANIPGSAVNTDESIDLAFAYKSIPRRDNDLNSQPTGGDSIGKNCTPPTDCKEAYPFKWPVAPVSLDMQATDPYTPLLRAYVNDRVQVRALAGAHMNEHSFLIHGVKFPFEPSYTNSGFLTTHAISLSEHFEMEFTLPPRTVSQGELPFADYLYVPSANAQGQTSGSWGILRAYDKATGDLNDPNSSTYLKPLPSNKTGTAPAVLDFAKLYADAPASQQREYTVIATTAEQLLPSNTLYYNTRGQATSNFPFEAGNALKTKLENPYALVYVNKDDIDDATGKLLPDRRVEPLILRANAGDWIKINLQNNFDKNAKTFATAAQFNNVGTFQTGNPFLWLFKNLKKYPEAAIINTSKSVGIHPQLVAYDITAGDGMNVGSNPKATIDPTGSTILYWYAGTLSFNENELVQTPVEFGSVNLAPAEPLLQHRKGLIGALVVEPMGSTWPCKPDQLESLPEYQYVYNSANKLESVDTTPKKTRAVATVRKADKTEFRELVLVMQADAYMYLASSPLPTTNKNPKLGAAFNYRTEPEQYRYSQTNFPPGPPAGTAARLANKLVAGALPVFDDHPEYADPQTPLLTVHAGQPVRVRWIYPAGAGGDAGGSSQVPVVHGHVFQEEPYINDSRELGFNPLSEWAGGRFILPGQTIDMLFPSAAGSFQVPGDYFYGTYIGQTPNDPRGQAQALWGLMRVIP